MFNLYDGKELQPVVGTWKSGNMCFGSLNLIFHNKGLLVEFSLELAQWLRFKKC